MKKRPGIALVEFILFSIVIVIICSYAIPSNQNAINSFSDSNKKEQILILDTGLSSWFRTHGGKYPDTLNNLKVVEIIPNSMDLSGYSYTLDASKTKYRLTTTFSDGTNYTSPLSNY